MIRITCLFLTLISLTFSKEHQRLEPIALYPDRVVDQEHLKNSIDKDGFLSKVTTPAIIPYLPAKGKATGTSLLICPGGGYAGLAWQDHVERLAPIFTQKGIAVIGLSYRTVHADNIIPEDPLEDFQAAIRMVKTNAKEWNLDSEKIVGLGFSAGSNLLLQYACNQEGEEINYLNFLCLWPFNQPASHYNIQRKGLETILFTSEEDKIAPSSFSVEIAKKLNETGNNAKLVQHSTGSHLAYNISPAGPQVDWITEFFKWLENKGL